MKRLVCFLLFTVSLCGCSSRRQDLLTGKIIDLTYPFDAETIYWPTEEDFLLEKESAGLTEKGYFYASNKFCAAEHGGTHLDAPIHFHKDGATVEKIPLSQTIGHGMVVDVSAKALKNPDYLIRKEDLLEWERKNGRIPSGAVVLLKTGYGRFWPSRKKYLGTDKRGKDAVPLLHFPGLHPGAAEWLVKNRGIKAVGIDTASIDYGQSQLFPTHQILTAENIPFLENVANLDQLPTKGFLLIALPMKIRGGTGSPTRVIAVVP